MLKQAVLLSSLLAPNVAVQPKIIIETQRTIMRECIPQDAAALAPMLAHEEVMRYSLYGPMSPEQTRERVAQYIEHYKVHGFGRWAIETKDTHKVIGYCGLTMSPAIDGEVFMEIGYRVSCDCWCCGFATEVAKAVKDYAFKTLGVKTLIAVVEPENKASARVIEKVGFTFWKEAKYHHLQVNVYKMELK